MKNLNSWTILISLGLFFLVGYYIFIRISFWKELKLFESKVPSLHSKFLILPKWFSYIRIIFVLIISGLLVIALMNPHISKKQKKEEKMIHGVDILFVVDVSLSMYAIDVPPNRLTRFKEILLSLLPDLQGNRLGMITFAGSSFLYCPMTSDISAFSDYVRGLDVDMIPEKGTNLLKALKKANEFLKSKKVQKNKLVILVTDGEDKSANLYDLEVPLVIWGVGTTKGGAIFYKDEQARISGYVSKDRKLYPSLTDGQVVISKLDEAYLKKLAARNNGEYWNLSSDPLSHSYILKKIDSIEKNANQVLQEALQRDGYHYFLIPAIALLFFELTVVEMFLRKFLRIFKKT